MTQIEVSNNQRVLCLKLKHVQKAALRAVSVIVVTFTLAAVAWSAPATTSAPEFAACSALLDVDLSSIQDAPTQVVSAKIADATDDAPAFCKVVAYVYPEVGVEIHLPLVKDWNGKLITAGNGGWAGVLSGDACDEHVRRGYACVTTDTGHKGRGDDGLWATDNLPAQVDFGYRAIHVATIAAKSIVSHFYSKDAQRAYFMSCSTGGYQGLVEAQRFPWDFDGIIAGAPDMDEADLTMREIWARRSLFDKNGKAILDDHALALLLQAALDQCDMDDGVKDGLIGNPIGCAMDPSKLLCKTGQTKECLSAASSGIRKARLRRPSSCRREICPWVTSWIGSDVERRNKCPIYGQPLQVHDLWCEPWLDLG